MKGNEIKTTNVAGIETACISRKGLVELIVKKVKEYDNHSPPFVIFDSNGQAISLANSDSHFNELIKSADLVHADGQSVVWFSRMFTNNTIPERSATTDTIHDIPNVERSNLKHFLLGGTEEVVSECSKILKEKYLNFNIVGIANGYFSSEQERSIIDKINHTKPDILWVGLGKPKEQDFIIKWKSQLSVPVIISCGGCYNYVTGNYKRAPLILQNLGLEWLYRALSDPKTFLFRYLKTNPHAIFCAITKSK